MYVKTYYRKPVLPKPSLDLKNRRVLIVEDFVSFRQTLRNMVKSLNAGDVDEAINGTEAMRKLAAKRYHIILCDYNLGPGKDGQQILEEARYRGYIDHATIFMMVTAQNQIEMVMGAVEYQPDEYLMKPFTKEILEKKLALLIERKQSIDEVVKAMGWMDYTKALHLADEQIALTPKNLSELLKLRGELLLRMARYDEATAFYEDVLNKGNFPWAYLGLANVNFTTGDYPRAEQILRDLIDANDRVTAAYDLLARIMEKTGREKEAQQVLMTAIQVSPKAIQRQKALGNLALRNEDMALAEKTFKTVLEQGKNSCFRSPSDFISMARVLTERQASEEALTVLHEGSREFTDRNDAQILFNITESFVHSRSSHPDEARMALRKAEACLEGFPSPPALELDIELAKAYFAAGEEERGIEATRRIVQSHHEDESVLDQVHRIFKDLQMEEKGTAIIAKAREEVIQLNNEGVRLYRQGEMVRAIDYFEKAAELLPANKTITANAAQVLLLYMRTNGISDGYLTNARKYLDRLRHLDASSKDLPKLLSIYNELQLEA